MEITPVLIDMLAEAAGVGVETIRFYEREGLIPEPRRNASGYRLYDVDAVRRLRFIRSAKRLGFTLAETKELLELRVTDTTGCDDVAARTRWKVAKVDARIRELRRIRRTCSSWCGRVTKTSRRALARSSTRWTRRWNHE